MEHARVQGQSRSRSRLSARLACTWNADEAWQMMNELVEEGARVGCHHCQRVMTNCNWWSHGCKHDAARSLESALESSVNGSRFSLCTHGVLHESDVRGRAQDYAQAVAFYKFPGEQKILMKRSKILAPCMVEALATTLASLWETLKRWGWTTQGGQTSPFFISSSRRASIST